MFSRTQTTFTLVKHLLFMFIVLEHCAGGDLFQYLDKREFKITEDRARNIAH